MSGLKWIKIKGHKIEDVFASYNFTSNSFEVEGFSGDEGIYEVSGDLPENFPNPATVTFTTSNGLGRFSLSQPVEQFQDQSPTEI